MKTNVFILRTKILYCFYSLIWFSTFALVNGFAQTADIVMYNGKIFTADEKKLYIQAIAIKGNKILATGTSDEIIKLADSNTKKIDLKGKTVVPGFNDQHDHAAFQHSPVRLKYETTDDNNQNWDGLPKTAVLDSIARLLTHAKPGEWITGMIGNRIFYDTGMRRSLDSIAPDNPVVLQIWWGHGMIANQKGLEAVGLSDALKDPVGGWYTRNSEGKIASIHENAQIPFWWAVSQLYPETVIKLMEDFGKEQLKGGITSTLFFGSSFSFSSVIQILQEASIPQRLRIVAWLRSTPEGRIVSEWPLMETKPTPMSTISGVKYLINHFGPLNYKPDTLKKIIDEALITKRQLMMHISGDSAFTVVLNLIKEAGKAEQWRPLRVRIEHNMIGNPSNEQRKTLREYGILIMHTPKYNQYSPLRSLLKDDILVGFAPDGTVNPFWEIMMVTTQQSNAEENITREQAVMAYTKTNAYAEFTENQKGTLIPGMLADIVVLSQDIFTIPADQLPITKSVLTMIDGKILYEVQ